MLGPDNTYAKQGVPLRNADVPEKDRQKQLIIDPRSANAFGAAALSYRVPSTRKGAEELRDWRAVQAEIRRCSDRA